jgi:flavin reductase (DIM6/NTAB) family NADH-FMN oxidoreductase RutF
MRKQSLALSKVYTRIEPCPVVLLTTAHAGKQDVMAMSWHTMLDFEPPLIGCVVSNRNHSYRLLRASGECVLNIPDAGLAQQVVGCGNTSGARTDKFRRYALTRSSAREVGAPLIDECFASLECRVVDTRMVPSYCLFVVEVVKAWLDPGARAPRTLHHRGRGTFMIAGESIRLPSRKK